MQRKYFTEKTHWLINLNAKSGKETELPPKKNDFINHNKKIICEEKKLKKKEKQKENQ